MDDESTQQSTQDKVMSRVPSFVAPSDQENVICQLVGSMGMSVSWALKPKEDSPHPRLWTFGRGAACDFVLDPMRKRLSGMHFKIWATEDSPPTLMLSDCSTNGTYLNNTKMVQGRNCMLVNGDVISVGIGVAEDEVRFIVSVPKPETQPQTESGINADYDFGQVIGQGAFAHVRLGILKETGEKFAIKIIQKTKISVNTAVKREIEVLRSLKNPYIVCLHAFYEDSAHYYLVMDYVPGGDLMDYVQNNGNIPEEPAREIVRQILLAIQHVHKIGISHRDLKPDNILIAQDDPVVVKVADFGLAKISNQGTFLKTFCGTLSYLAPEVLATRNSGKSSTKGYSELVDIWSVGCLAYVILTGYMPFNGTTQEELYKSVLSGNYNREPLKAMQLSSEALDFVRSMLETDVTKRPNATQALNHPWIIKGLPQSDFGLSASGVSQQEDLPQNSDLRGMSKMNIQSSQVQPVELEHSVPGLSELSDSEPDSSQAQQHVREVLSQRFDRESINAAVRDIYDDDSNEVSGLPMGAWLKLATQPGSVPFKDLFVNTNKFTMGQGRNCSVDVEIRESLISDFHARIVKEDGKVWLYDHSTNGCFVNGTQGNKNQRTRLYDNDSLWLYVKAEADSRAPGHQLLQYLGFDVQFLDKDGLDAVRRSSDVVFEDFKPAAEYNIKPAEKNPELNLNKAATKKRSLSSLGTTKRKKQMVFE